MPESLVEQSRWLYTLVVGLMALERGIELVIARRNHRWLLERGGIEVGAEHYPWIVLLHTVFLAACPLEVWLLKRPLLPWLAAPMTAALVGSLVLRYLGGGDPGASLHGAGGLPRRSPVDR